MHANFYTKIFYLYLFLRITVHALFRQFNLQCFLIDAFQKSWTKFPVNLDRSSYYPAA